MSDVRVYQHTCRYCATTFDDSDRLTSWSACTTHEYECSMRPRVRVVKGDDGLPVIEVDRHG